jgi:Uma2 family endonuclease
MGDQMSVVSLDRPGPWRFEELADLPADGRRYEVVDGNLIVTPPPTHYHQFVSNSLARQLSAVSGDDWMVLVEFALPLGTDGRIPDVSVIRADAPISRRPAYPVGPEYFGLVVEVVSPRTRKTDRFAKPGEYAEAGIPCFWRVELDPTLRVYGFALESGSYVEVEGSLPVPWGYLDLDLTGLDPVRSLGRD